MCNPTRSRGLTRATCGAPPLPACQSVGINSIQEGDCWAWDKYALLFIGALVMLVGFVLFVPIFTYKKIRENIPVGGGRALHGVGVWALSSLLLLL